jgi:hypothetical protein
VLPVFFSYSKIQALKFKMRNRHAKKLRGEKMKKDIRKINSLGLVLLFLANIAVAQSENTAAATPECETHQPCPADQVCKCGITPSSAYDRYYYFDFSNLKNKSHYTCTFNNSPDTLTMDLGKSIFPTDSHYECTGSCPRIEPGDVSKILLDTTKVTAAESTMIIRYFVPAGDMPNELTVECQKDGLNQ